MKYGFIGLGNMAGAIIEGMAASGRFRDDNIYGFNRSREKTVRLKEKHGLIPCGSVAELAEKCDVVILSVKPQVMPEVLDEIAQHIDAGKTVLTIAAGKSCSWYEEKLGAGVPVVRIMPNINAKVKAAVTAICGGSAAGQEHLKIAEGVFSTVGKVFRIEEKMFPAFSAVGGASGAFVLMYIDALAEAGVRAGFARPFAEELAEGVVLGTAALARSSEEHPIALMNQVCSPAGTTIEGVATLRRLGFDSAVQQAVQAIIDRDKAL